MLPAGKSSFGEARSLNMAELFEPFPGNFQMELLVCRDILWMGNQGMKCLGRMLERSEVSWPDVEEWFLSTHATVTNQFYSLGILWSETKKGWTVKQRFSIR
jgi:hypothetical protein